MSLKALIRQNRIDLDMRFIGFCQFCAVFAGKKWQQLGCCHCPGKTRFLPAKPNLGVRYSYV